MHHLIQKKGGRGGGGGGEMIIKKKKKTENNIKKKGRGGGGGAINVCFFQGGLFAIRAFPFLALSFTMADELEQGRTALQKLMDPQVQACRGRGDKPGASP